MKKIKLKKKNIIIILVFLISIIIFIISLINIIIWLKDSKSTNKIINDLENNVDVTEIPDNENTMIIEQKEIDKANPYWDFVKLDLIYIDFEELYLINKDTVGWLQVNGTNINYPVVQASDNDYYLTHTYDKKYNKAGWVFLDYRNNPNDFDKNNIIYAHGRQDKTMFGSLKNIITNGWLNDDNNFVIKYATKYETSLWQVFSVYRIPTTNDYINVYYENNEDFLAFIELIQKRSSFDFGVTLLENDKIITLSTCYNNDDKVVLHAKLIKYEKKLTN